MDKFKKISEENDESPSAPEKHVETVGQKIIIFLSSMKLAMGLLIAILACCVIGVTIFRGERAWALIFYTLWFNGLLVLLIVNVAFCFFGRIWGRRATLISLGMILFHLSFVTMFAGIVYNSLFYFRGILRLTEGETLPNGEPQSYDSKDKGKFFQYSKLEGDTTLNKLHLGYKVDGHDKGLAYELTIGDGRQKKRGVSYITKNLEYKGVTYIPEKEGFSLLTILYDKQGKELYGAYIPLQSLKQKDKTVLITSGTKDGPGSFLFPQQPEAPLVNIQVAYRPSKLIERAGDVFFQVWPPYKGESMHGEKPMSAGSAAIGKKFGAGNYSLEVREVRYWVGMKVTYEPGQPIVLASMWSGLSGMIITFYGRLRKHKNISNYQV